MTGRLKSEAPRKFLSKIDIMEGFTVPRCENSYKYKSNVFVCKKNGNLCYGQACDIKKRLQETEDSLEIEKWNDLWYATMPFGMYSGKTIGALMSEDPEYLWKLTNLDFLYGNLKASLCIHIQDITCNKLDRLKNEGR